jgi:protein TonB
MLISKFDLYKSEWLELVFEDRNKAYGAYELRRHSARTTANAMAIAFSGIVAVAFIIGIVFKPVAMVPPAPYKITPVNIKNYVYPAVVTPPKPVAHTRAQPHPAAAPATPAASHAFVPLVVTVDPLSVAPPKTSALSGTISSTDTKGTPGGVPGAGPVNGPGTSAAPGPDGGVYEAAGLERMPEPYGGAAAWAKFLRKNLSYPGMAIDEHMQGRVFVSFIIEKDGHLSNFVVERGAGYGMDEEAMRVLKLAPAWKPGIQNNQPVRVKYTIPINFQLAE